MQLRLPGFLERSLDKAALHGFASSYQKSAPAQGQHQQRALRKMAKLGGGWIERKQADLVSHENPPTTVNLFGYLLTVSRQLSFYV